MHAVPYGPIRTSAPSVNLVWAVCRRTSQRTCAAACITSTLLSNCMLSLVNHRYERMPSVQLGQVVAGACPCRWCVHAGAAERAQHVPGTDSRRRPAWTLPRSRSAAAPPCTQPCQSPAGVEIGPGCALWVCRLLGTLRCIHSLPRRRLCAQDCVPSCRLAADEVGGRDIAAHTSLAQPHACAHMILL